MPNSKIPTNSISFGTVVHLGQSTIDIKLDNATLVNNVRVYGTMPLYGSRAVLIWDERKSEWVCISGEFGSVTSSNGTSTGASSFLQLSDTPSVYGVEGQVVGMGANNRLVFLNRGAGESIGIDDILVSAPVTKLLNGDGTFTIGITLDEFLQTTDVAGVFPIVTNVSGGQVLISFDESGFDHGELSGLGDDDHVLYATVSEGRDAYRAGQLLRSLSTSVGQPFRLNGTSSADLTSDISLAFVSGDITDTTKGLSVTDNKIGIALATQSGLELVANKLQVADTIAGDGLGISSKILSVNTSGGITKSSDNVVVDTAYNFTWSGNHTWNTGIARFNGTLQVDTDLVFVGAQSITTTIDTLTLSPVASLILRPQNNIVALDDNVSLESDNYDSQTIGMRITHNGQGDFRYLFADEMHVKSFIADLEQALAGGQIIAKSVALLAESFTVPNYGASTTVVVESFPGFPNAYVFQNGDTLAVRIFNRTNGSAGVAGGLEVSFLFGTVQSIGIDSESKTQSWTFTRLSSALINGLSAGGMATTGLVVNEGTIVLDFGVPQNGYYEVSAVDGLLGSNSPYAQTVTWGTHPWYDRVVRSRMGNLNGIFSAGQEYGLYAGNGSSNSHKYLRISDVAVELRNLTFNIYSGNNTVFRIDPDVPSMALGSTIPTGYSSAEAGFWMGLDAGAYKVRIGDDTNYLRWTGTELTIAGTINILNPGAISASQINNDAQWTDDTVANQALSAAQAAQSSVTDLFEDLEDTNAVLDGKIVTYRQTTAPVGASEGDLWFDTDDGNKIYIYASGTWVLARDTGIATAIMNAASAQTTANSKITTFYAASAPTALVTGDLWWNTSTNLLSRWSGSAWVPVSVTNTNQLTDGAGLGNTALWGGINVPPRFGDAPLSGTGLYLTATHLGYYDSSKTPNRWLTYMDNTGAFYLNGAENHALTWNGTTLNVIGDIQAKNGAAVSIWIRPTTESISIGSGSGYDAEDVTYDSTLAGIFMGKRISTGKYTFRIGNNEQYVRWDGNNLSISGTIKVQAGSDIIPSRYRPASVDVSMITIVNLGGSIRFNRTATIITAEGQRYYTTATIVNESRIVVEKGHAQIVAYVFKNGHGLYRIPYLGGEPLYCNGIDNALVGDLDAPSMLDMNFERADRYYDPAYYSLEDRENHVVVASIRLTSDYLKVSGMFSAGDFGSTIIGPGYIRTDSLAAISANLGHITSGSIVVGDSNGKLWLNVDDDNLKLAIGNNDRNSAPFRVYNNGRIYAGDGTGSMDFNPGAGLTVTGVINASSGVLGNLAVTGILSLDSPGNSGGSLRWSYSDGQYWGLISSWGIRYTDRNAGASSATIHIARPASEAKGIIDIDMFTAASAKWDYGIHISDGGNSNNTYSALFHGESSKSDFQAVDRIYNAYTENVGLGNPYSDGYYSDLAAGIWNDFDSSGVSFKGISRGGQPVAVFQQQGSLQNGPVVFAGSDQAYRAVYHAELSQPNQVAFYVDQNGMSPNSFVALNGGNGGVTYISCILMKNHEGLPDDVKNSGAIVDPPSGYTVVYARNNLMRFRTKTSGGTLDPETTMATGDR